MAPSPVDRAAARRELKLREARGDFLAFARYAFGWEPAQHHREWTAAIAEHRRVVVVCPPEFGKTSLLTIAWLIWRLGRDCDECVAIVSETETQASRPLAAIREAITSNPRVREVFPNLRPAGGAREKWSDTEILVERTKALKDPSIQAVGIGGPLLGSRLTIAVLDDCVSWESAWTPGQRAKAVTWYRSTLVGRMLAGGQIVAVGNPWHADDLLGELQRSGEYRALRTPAVAADGSPTWPEVWPDERLEQRRRELGPTEFARQFLLQLPSEEGSRFQSAWFEHAFAAAAAEGVALVDRSPSKLRAFTGVDLAVGTGSSHDRTVLFTIALRKDGRRQVLNVESGRWLAPEIISRVRSVHERFEGRIRVESNGAQKFLVDVLRSEGIRIEAHTTTAQNKGDPSWGVESLAAELEAGRWIVPEAPATRAWAAECVAYAPGSHTGDALIASWLARESARAAEAAPMMVPAPMEDPLPDFRALRQGRDFIVARPGGLDRAMWPAVSAEEEAGNELLRRFEARQRRRSRA